MKNIFFRFLIIVNMYIAVILENYSQATEDVADGITDEDYDLFYEIWSEFDPNGTQYIDYKSVSEFLDCLEPPLQISRPNKFKVSTNAAHAVKCTLCCGQVQCQLFTLVCTDNPHGHPDRAVDRPQDRGGSPGEGFLLRPARLPHPGLLRQKGEHDRGTNACGGNKGTASPADL